jgi:hypothetical protein
MDLKDIASRITRLGKLSEDLTRERKRWQSCHEPFVSEYRRSIRGFQNGIDDARLALLKAKQRLERSIDSVKVRPHYVGSCKNLEISCEKRPPRVYAANFLGFWAYFVDNTGDRL